MFAPVSAIDRVEPHPVEGGGGRRGKHVCEFNCGNSKIQIPILVASTKRIRDGRCSYIALREFPVSCEISRLHVRISRWLGLNVPVRNKKFPFRFHRELQPKPLERELF